MLLRVCCWANNLDLRSSLLIFARGFRALGWRRKRAMSQWKKRIVIWSEFFSDFSWNCNHTQWQEQSAYSQVFRKLAKKYNTALHIYTSLCPLVSGSRGALYIGFRHSQWSLVVDRATLLSSQSKTKCIYYIYPKYMRKLRHDSILIDIPLPPFQSFVLRSAPLPTSPTSATWKSFNSNTNLRRREEEDLMEN